MTIWDILFKLTETDPNVVFVGSVASVINSVLTDERKSIYDCKDIDIVIPTTTNLKTLGEVFTYEGSSVYSLTKKRAYMVYNEVLIDIFIDEMKPEDVRIFKVGELDLKIVSLDAQVRYYKDRLEKTPEEVRMVLEEKYKVHHQALLTNKNIL